MDHLLDIYQDYTTAINLALELLPWERVGRMLQVLHHARTHHQTIFVMGSGTGTVAAQHLAHELDEPMPDDPPFQVVTLVESAQPFLVWGDNRSYDSMFLRLINRLCPGDIAIAISTHGLSPDILNALRQARARACFTIAVGSDPDGILVETVDLPVLIPNNGVDQVEDIQQILIHILVKALRGYRAYSQQRKPGWPRRWRVAEYTSTRRRRCLVFFNASRCSRR